MLVAVVAGNRIHVDHGLALTGNGLVCVKPWPLARKAIPLVVTNLARLARSLSDARAIADEITGGQVRLNLGGSV